jgi:uncharacterized membrane protein YecN with MAPEG domain
MAWVHLAALLALAEYFWFSFEVGEARRRYGVKAPATSGNEHFERYFRVQQNTLELLVGFFPALWLAAAYWPPDTVAAIGAVFVVGRLLYYRGYVREPRTRHIGFMLSVVPIAVLIVAAAVGVVRDLL